MQGAAREPQPEQASQVPLACLSFPHTAQLVSCLSPLPVRTSRPPPVPLLACVVDTRIDASDTTSAPHVVYTVMLRGLANAGGDITIDVVRGVAWR